MRKIMTNIIIPIQEILLVINIIIQEDYKVQKTLYLGK